MAEFDFLENPRLMRVPTKKWIENPCERILVPDRDFVYMLEIQDVPVRARDKFIHWRMMTSEEEQTFKVCEQERFWTRSVPFMIGVSAITAVLSRRARYNLWQKAICQYAALTVGRDLGHFTYWYLEHERWAERFMHLQGSTYGEALRRRDCQLQRWYPNGAPPIPKHLLYTRTEPPSSLPPPLPPLRVPLHPPQPPTPSPHLITASLHSEEEVLQFPSDIDEKYTDYSIEYSSPLFTSSLGETLDLDEEERTLDEEEENPEVTIPSFSSSSNDDDDDDKDNKSSSSTPTSFPSSSPPAFPSSSPPAFPSSSPPAFPSSSPPAFPSSSPPAFPSSSPPAFPSSSSPPAFPSSSPPAFPSSPVSWDEDDASSHEDEDDERIQRENVLPDDSVAATEDTEEFISPEKEKKRNIYGDIIEDDIQDER